MQKCDEVHDEILYPMGCLMTFLYCQLICNLHITQYMALVGKVSM